MREAAPSDSIAVNSKTFSVHRTRLASSAYQPPSADRPAKARSWRYPKTLVLRQ